MYKEYFHLSEMPFSIAPDPRFLYLGTRHREALAHLLYGVQGEGGIVLLTGEIGTGKTTLCRCLLEQIHEQCDVAYILNPKMSVNELLCAICDEFHIGTANDGASVKTAVDALNGYLLEANAADRRAVLIIDEAQNLHPDVLEQLRLLTNLETSRRKLLQIILIGQPELQDMLRRPELRQVAQRVVARYHLTNLTQQEVAAYVTHRLRVSGAMVRLFPEGLIGSLARLTGGVPRLINLVCDRALLGTYVHGQLLVTPKILRQAAREVFGISRAWPSWRRIGGAAAIVSGLCAVGVAGAMTAGYPAIFDWSRAGTAAAQAVPTAAPPSPAPAPPAITVEAATIAPPDLGWPTEMGPRARSEELAFRALFKLHGVVYAPRAGEAPCKTAEAANLHCLYGRGGLEDLRRLNQPALLTLDGDGKGPGYDTVLTSLDQGMASFDVAGTPRRVPLASIAPLWSGAYVVLWRAPTGFQNTLSEGSRGPAVSWLRAGLARLQGGTAAGPAVFDKDLIKRLKAFQMNEGIVPDGIAGPLTIIRLSMCLHENQPRLIPEDESR